ncbi:DUF1702 family protein [Streptomyces sp. NPDC001796]|uniref:DUF1702 family protein n=1 Tax=Streptomyces sp. NPDC001796 TaxID=3364609 RepID=UPI003675331D
MASRWAALRRRVLTPNTSQTKLSTRGFYEKSPQARDQLEQAGAMFLAGFAFAAEAEAPRHAETGLEKLPDGVRGFAYEGAGMAFAIRDAMAPTRSRKNAAFLQGRGNDHVYMVYVGAGWALGRLPGLLWNRATAALPDPVLRWLVLDGYGFHQAYFHTAKYVDRQYVQRGFPWPAKESAGYANRVIDQGIGRAMWFVHGADPRRVAGGIDAFPQSRRADLYAGASLAATYAGGLEEAELLVFRQRARHYLPQVAQASAFAATARVRSHLVTPHTRLATEILAGTTPENAAKVCLESFPDVSERTPAGEPAFEVWRQRIATALTARTSTEQLTTADAKGRADDGSTESDEHTGHR